MNQFFDDEGQVIGYSGLLEYMNKTALPFGRGQKFDVRVRRHYNKYRRSQQI